MPRPRKIVNYRKKTCRVCGEKKWLSEFKKDKQCADGHCNTCKECANAQSRVRWKETRTKKDKIYFGTKKFGTGLYTGLIEVKNGRPRQYLSEESRKRIARIYPTTPNADIMSEFNISRDRLNALAKEMHLRKDPDYRHSQVMSSLRKMHRIVRITHSAKRHKVELDPRSHATRFKPGHKPKGITPEQMAERTRKMLATRAANKLRKQREQSIAELKHDRT